MVSFLSVDSSKNPGLHFVCVCLFQCHVYRNSPLLHFTKVSVHDELEIKVFLLTNTKVLISVDAVLRVGHLTSTPTLLTRPSLPLLLCSQVQTEVPG